MGMSRFYAHNMRGMSMLPGWCVICGRPMPERHHVVPRSLGGSSGPLVHLCGCGNNLFDADLRLLHHGAAEMHRLWFWWCDGTDSDIAPAAALGVPFGWIYVLTDEPIDWMGAVRLPDWSKLP